jgi:mannose-6-phosphate isomerase-like protein (cupin superfamily)
MKVNINEIGGEITKDNETYVLEDNNLLEHMTLSKTTLKPNQSTRGHSHDALEEVYFFTKGDGRMVLGEKEFDVKADDVILIPQGKFHRVINDKDESMEFVCVFEKYDRKSDTAKY